MTAMGIDPNNDWWPIAWAVTEAESYEQWKWFLGYLAEDIQLQENAPRFVFMSDQQKGLAKAILEDFPQSEHRFCVQHIYNNFKKRFIGENFKEMLWELRQVQHTYSMFSGWMHCGLYIPKHISTYSGLRLKKNG
ncbi:uncharacterized protein LOC121761814 [Salvia splendens]|uniref:uncharacterized protein LOC121761814 n=1 Tax=Salvia splendens TaxID=180675 RepID=UPI001C269C41|nr:uncharacterized protein LOC121761814 [Salvia splendens]